MTFNICRLSDNCVCFTYIFFICDIVLESFSVCLVFSSVLCTFFFSLLQQLHSSTTLTTALDFFFLTLLQGRLLQLSQQSELRMTS